MFHVEQQKQDQMKAFEQNVYIFRRAGLWQIRPLTNYIMPLE